MGNDEMTNNAVALWVSKAGMNNFELAKERGIWGTDTKPVFDVTPGSYVIFGGDAGGPRVSQEEFRNKIPKMLEVGVITTHPYHSNEPIWEDSQSKIYPWRFGFEMLIDASNSESQPKNFQGLLTPDLLDAFHWSANQFSTPKPFTLDESQLPMILSEYETTGPNTDIIRIGFGRGEQNLLRRILLSNSKNSECELCGMNYPETFLVAAHIKKRAKCNNSERLDFQNIAMLACIFGCDALYEKGFITVRDQKIIISKATLDLPSILEKTKTLENRIIPKYLSSKKYFEWHNSNVFLN
jgi:hypothetical protein